VGTGVMDVILSPDGSTQHKVILERSSTDAISKLKGSQVSLKKNGTVSTRYEEITTAVSGMPTVLQVIVDTDNAGETDTSYALKNLTTGELQMMEPTLRSGSKFHSGNHVEIDKEITSDGKEQIFLKIDTELDTPIIIQ
jgi:hypothetical protein